MYISGGKKGARKMSTRVMVFTPEITCNLDADTLILDGDCIKVYKGEILVGIFDISVVRATYITKKEK